MKANPANTRKKLARIVNSLHWKNELRGAKLQYQKHKCLLVRTKFGCCCVNGYLNFFSWTISIVSFFFTFPIPNSAL
jgi:hypothetical protein